MTTTYSPESQCWGKIRYANKKAAKKALKQVESRWGERLGAYHCPYDRADPNTNHYHIGHKVSDTLKRLKREEMSSGITVGSSS